MTKKFKIYFDPQLADYVERQQLFEILKSKERHDKKPSELDINLQGNIDWVIEAETADFWVLPMLWNYYYDRNLQQQAIAYCERAFVAGKKVLSMSGGDQGITIPVKENTIVYRQSGYRSKLKKNERTMPFILTDPVGVFLENEVVLFVNEGSLKPIVGFCGMAPHGLKTAVKERVQIIVRNLKSRLGINNGDIQEIMSSSNLRFDVLEVFRKDNRFATNYIIRQKYRGGLQTPENREKTTLEYYNNQLESDIITCVRGVGNFSLRLYETLAMGRIPVFVDTDAPLPEISGKNWNDYVIWVDRKNIAQAPEIAMNWLKNKDIGVQKRKNRQLWIDEMRLDNFWLNQLKDLCRIDS